MASKILFLILTPKKGFYQPVFVIMLIWDPIGTYNGLKLTNFTRFLLKLKHDLSVTSELGQIMAAPKILFLILSPKKSFNQPVYLNTLIWDPIGT